MMQTILNAPARVALVQLNKARKSVEHLTKNSGVLEIRKRKAVIPVDATAEEIKKLNETQALKNLNDMVDVLIAENIDDVFEVLSLFLMISKEEAEQIPLNELFKPLFDLLKSDAVRRFFTELMS